MHLQTETVVSTQNLEENELEENGEGDVESISPTDQVTQQPPLSKKAQKKAARAAYLASVKIERRAREKEARKRKKKERAEAERKQKEEHGDDGIQECHNFVTSTKNATQRKKRKLDEDREVFGARVIIDLGFDDMMIDKEVVSLTSQLAYTYSTNRHAARPFSKLIFTSLGGRTRTRLDAMNDAGYRRWVGTEWWEKGYDRLWTGTSNHGEAVDSLTTSSEGMLPGQTEEDTRSNVVYLTADSEEELEELRDNETYIIGGICDHNRYKNLCLDKAVESRIRHARLPIGRYIAALTTRKVLTVNQVFEILIKWVETRDWEEAFWSVIPQRKFQHVPEKRAEEKDDVEDHNKGEMVVINSHEVEDE